MLEYKNPFAIRGQHLNCPLPLTLEAYWACEADCLHCMGRRLNQIWGTEQRVADPVKVEAKLKASQKRNNPKSPLAVALKNKKSLWIGRKSDPYQPIEMEKRVTRAYVRMLTKLDWPFIICSRYIINASRDERLFKKAKNLLTFLVEITPGAEKDWEVFESKRTTPIEDRLKYAKRWTELGIHVGVRGEPFIPSYHTYKDFRDILKRLKSYGLKSYNTYNLHMNEYTLKRLHNAGLDIEKIWRHNQDRLWKPIQRKLCEIADEEGIILGCPDFVNVPKGWKSRTNTCCGVEVCNAFTYNTHNWRLQLQEGYSCDGILIDTWEGIGTQENIDLAEIILKKKSKDFYTMGDAEL